MDVHALARQWLELDKDPKTRKEIETLLAANDVSALSERLSVRIAFGTAGLRARVEAGFARMNSLIVIQTSQGLAQHLLDTVEDAGLRGVVVGHDTRRDSKRFAQLAAAAFMAKGLKVHLFQDYVHTPMVPFTVKHVGAVAGVMITASHNPKEDNGYKVYGGNGCQINSPEDAAIAAAILQNLEPITWETNIGGQLFDALESPVDEYHKCLASQMSLDPAKTPRFVYTPMHGVGFRFMAGSFSYVKRAFRSGSTSEPLSPSSPVSPSRSARFGPHMELVSAQVNPDPNFPTVKFPNPEEDGALDLAKQAADTLSISLILANDPDADRFAAAEKVEGQWHQFKGDEVGVLLGHYIFERNKNQLQDFTMLTSAVSSQMLGVIGQAEGFVVEETLTGFKWIGNRAKEIGDKAVFGYEEALGYMLPRAVFDKDGVSAALLFLEMCSQIGSPYVKLQGLYQQYGYFETMNTYWKTPSVALTATTFEHIQQDPTMIKPLGASKEHTRVRDLGKGSDTSNADGKATLPSSSDTQMITVWHTGDKIFRDGVRYTIRASGTEPKIKVYIECRSKKSAVEARKGATEVLQAIGRSWFSDPKLQIEKRFSHLVALN